MAIPTQFNRADGAGYEFVADAVLALDGKNPQVASRLCHRLPLLAGAGKPAGAHKAQAALRRIAAATNALGRRERHRQPARWRIAEARQSRHCEAPARELL